MSKKSLIKGYFSLRVMLKKLWTLQIFTHEKIAYNLQIIARREK